MSVSEYKEHFDRTKQDPVIPNQGCVLISTLPLNEPKITETGDKVYGFMKVRGVFPGSHVNNKNAIDAAETLIREFDSKHEIQIVPMGMWVPYSHNGSHIVDKIDAKMNPDDKTEIHLRDQAARDKAAKDRALARELKEKSEDVANNDIYDDKESLKYYGMKMVVLIHLQDAIANLEEKIRETKAKMSDVKNICKTLDENHPNYNSEWVDLYNEERKKVGIPEFVVSDRFDDWYHDRS